MTGIYKITNLINGKTYIGQSIDIKRRFWDHRCISHETNRHLRYAMRKYGKDAFSYEIIEECAPEELNAREQFWIAELKPEYNVMSGGQGRGRRHSQETKQRLREVGRRSWEKKSEAEKAAICKNNLKGQPVGHAVSVETRSKLRDANIGKQQSLETVEKRKSTIAEKKRLGYVQTNSGHRKKVVCVETGEIFESVKDAAARLCVHPSNITSVLKGRQKTAKGYHFGYLKV